MPLVGPLGRREEAFAQGDHRNDRLGGDQGREGETVAPAQDFRCDRHEQRGYASDSIYRSARVITGAAAIMTAVFAAFAAAPIATVSQLGRRPRA